TFADALFNTPEGYDRTYARRIFVRQGGANGYDFCRSDPDRQPVRLRKLHGLAMAAPNDTDEFLALDRSGHAGDVGSRLCRQKTRIHQPSLQIAWSVVVRGKHGRISIFALEPAQVS